MDDRVNLDGCLRPGLLLSEFGPVGRDDKSPLIVKAKSEDSNETTWSTEQLPLVNVDTNLSELNEQIADCFKEYSCLKSQTIGNVEVPLFKGKPTLLFWKLGEGHSSELLDRCLNRDMTVVLGTISERLGNDATKNQDYLTRFIKCLLCARLYAFARLVETTGVTPQEWLLFQLQFDFTPLMNEFRKLEPKLLDDRLINSINLMAKKNQAIRKTPELELVPVFFDEAQSTVNQHHKKFVSSKDEPSKPLFYGICYTFLLVISHCSFTACGTGLRLEEAAKMVASMANKSDTDIRYVVSNTFNSALAVQEYLKQFESVFQIPDEEAAYFAGRVRFTATFAEFQLRQAATSVDLFSTSDYINFVTASISDLSLSYLFDDLERQQAPDYSTALRLLKECVLCFLHFGKAMKCTAKESWIFERAFGRLVECNSGYLILIDEPLILFTIMKRLEYNHDDLYGGALVKDLMEQAESRISQNLTSSSQGFLRTI
ncbi:UNVERIFIED_CONTAM: hypothetical protein HDU68_010595 [Siphonaria sp. JEL0065]|nr:hypothetical protein HDU68_010595 [Siphonaria sp. JEL0065]